MIIVLVVPLLIYDADDDDQNHEDDWCDEDDDADEDVTRSSSYVNFKLTWRERRMGLYQKRGEVISFATSHDSI